MRRAEAILSNGLVKAVLGMAVAIMLVNPVLAEESDALEDLKAGAALVMESDSEPVELAAGEALFLDETQDLEVVETDDTNAETEKDDTEDDIEVDSNFVMSNVKDSMNVRMEANEDSEAVGKLYKNCGGVILEQSNGWTKLQSGDLIGWAKDDYLLFGEEALALREETGYLRATILTDALRVRKEPGEDAGVYGLVEKGQILSALEEKDGWVAVQYDDDTVGYVSQEFCSVEFNVDAGKTMEQIKKEEEEEAKKKLSQNQGAVDVAVSDVTLLAALIQCEAGRESYDGKLAVGAVVMNRVRSGSYPGSVSEVINAPGQFPPATNGKVAKVLASGPSASCQEAAQAAINGTTNVGTATHFRVAGSTEGIVIGNHVFW